MSEQFQISIESPQSGWMSLRLRGGFGGFGGEASQQFVAAMSHAPYDSLRDLMEALRSLLAGSSSEATVKWNAEPEEFDFVFETANGEVELRVVRHPGHRRAPETSRVVFVIRTGLAELSQAVLEELRQLRARSDTDVFEQNWRRPFPQRELAELAHAVESI